MGLLISIVTAIVIGLSLTANPVKLVNKIQAKADTDTRVSANTTANGTIGSQKGIANINAKTDDKLETNTTANVTDDKDDNFEEKDEDHGKAKGEVRVSAFNNRSGKFMHPLIPKVAVDHSGSLDASGNLTIGEENNR